MSHLLTVTNLHLLEAAAGVYAHGHDNSTSDLIDSASSLLTIKLTPPLPQPPSRAHTLAPHTIATLASDYLSDDSDAFVVRAPALLRKKSGELVKLSLKLPSLAKCMSTPALSSPNKSVRFASRLANIKMFDGKDSPSTVSTADNTPMGSPQYVHDDFFEKKNGYFLWDWGNEDVSDITSDTSSEDDDDAPAAPAKYQIVYSNYTLPKSIYDKQASNVYVQSLALSPDRNALVGLIMVKNLAFEKKITIKLTFNGWHTSLIINNILYVKSFASINFDQFRFSIPLTNMSKYINVELVVKYEVGGIAHWDNNNHQNYYVKLQPAHKQQTHQVKPYSYLPNNQTPHFDDLVNRLIGFQLSREDEIEDYIYKEKTAPVATRPKSDLHLRYNLSDELENVKPRTTPPSTLVTSAPTRPKLAPSVSFPGRPLSASASASAITLKPRYSQSFKAKQATAPGIADDATFNSASYTNLLQSYCFYNGDTGVAKSVAKLQSTTSIPSFNSSASTFHALSDSIHI